MLVLPLLLMTVFYPALLGWAALLIALGNAGWIERMLILYGAGLLFGLGLAVIQIGDERTSVFLIGCLMIIASWSSNRKTWQWILTGVGTLLTLMTLLVVRYDRMDGRFLLGGPIVIISISTVFLFLRVVGYRVYRYRTALGETEMNIGTGHGLDEWMRIIPALTDNSVDPAVIRHAIKSHGQTGAWTNLIETNYLKLSGHIPVDRSSDGWAQFVTASNPSVSFFQRLQVTVDEVRTCMRFSVIQLIVWSSAAASVFAIVSLIARNSSTGLDYRLPIAMFLILCPLTYTIGISVLSPRASKKVKLLTVCTVLGNAWALPIAMQLGGMVMGPVNVLSLYCVIIAVAQVTAFQLLRNLGYRIVRLRCAKPVVRSLEPTQSISQHSACSINAL